MSVSDGGLPEADGRGATRDGTDGAPVARPMPAGEARVRTRRWLGHAAAAVLLAAVVLSVLWPLVGWHPSRSLGGDFMAQTYPWRVHVARTLLAGRLPHWSAHQGFGFPLLADIETAVFYPGTLLGVLLFGPDIAYHVLAREVAGHLIVAGLGLFLVLRRAGTGWAAGVAGALVFASSGFMWAHLAHATIIQSATWIPWALLAASHLVDRPTARAAAGLAIALALSVLGGHPQIAYYAGLAVGVLLIVLGWPARGAPPWHLVRGPRLPLGLFAGLLAVGLTALQTIPTAVLTRHSVRWRPTAAFLVHDALPWDRLLTFLVPLAYEGTPRWRNVDEFHAYVGVLPLVLAGWALLVRRDRWTLLFGALAALGLLGALHVPPVAWVVAAGHFRIPARAVLFWDLGVAGLAGLGAAALLRARGALHGPERWLLGGLVGALGVALLAAAWMATAGARVLLDAGLSPQFSHHWRAFVLGVAGALLVVAAVRSVAPRALASALLVLGAVVDVLSFPAGVAWSPVPPHGWWPEEPRLALLAERAGPYRVSGRLMGRPWTQEANAGLVYRVPLPTVYSSLTLSREGAWAHLLRDAPPPELLRTAGVRWVVTRRGQSMQGLVPSGDPELAHAFERRGFLLWEVPDPLPRAYLSGTTRLVRGAVNVRAALPALDPRREVLVERPEASCGSAAASPGPGAISLLADEPTRVLLRVRAPAPAPLVLSDTYYPGWRASIDDAPAPLHRANLLFRMVCVPAGEHQVEFRFTPPGFRPGLFVTAVSVLVTAGVLLPVGRALPWGRGRPAVE